MTLTRLSKSHVARGVISLFTSAILWQAVAACGDAPIIPRGTDPDGDPQPGKDGGPRVDAGKDGGGEPPTDCTPDACSGHGVCNETSDGAACTCDDGFGAGDCSQKTVSYGRRIKIANDLADPDVLKLDDDHYVVSGTGGVGFSFYESNDLVTWTKTKEYRPQDKDPGADYCFLWAPDLVRDAGKTWIYFSAHKGPQGGTSCPPPANSEVTTYRASAEDGTLDFGVPEPLFTGTNGARTFSAKSCPAEGCNRAIRIDATLYGGRLYYVFFGNGRNNIASVSMSNNNDIIVHNGLGGYNAYEENINEAPELFERNGKTYLFFSAAFFDSQYAQFYVTGSKPSELTRDRPIRRLSTPVRRKNSSLIESHGHNSITTRRGETFNFFHMGVFNGSGGLMRRDTYVQRITWNGDDAMNQNAVALSWNALGGGNAYSLDLVLRDGTVVGPCMGAGTIGQATTAQYLGVCPDGGDRLVHRADIASFRVYASPGSDFKLVGEAPYDGYSDTLQVTVKAP